MKKRKKQKKMNIKNNLSSVCKFSCGHDRDYEIFRLALRVFRFHHALLAFVLFHYSLYSPNIFGRNNNLKGKKNRK